MPRHCRRSCAIAAKSIFNSIGTIISQISAATGRLTLATSASPSVANSPGRA